jgi:hypothetical protein
MAMTLSSCGLFQEILYPNRNAAPVQRSAIYASISNDVPVQDYVYQIAVGDKGSRIRVRYKLDMYNQIMLYTIQVQAHSGWVPVFNIRQVQHSVCFNYDMEDFCI